jgi:hypothetical protein
MNPDAATAPTIKSVRGSWPDDHAATSRLPSGRHGASARCDGHEEIAMILVAMFLSGVLLYVVGSILERRELAERERWWRELHGRDGTTR